MKKIYSLYYFILYNLTSKNEHSVHSPFVFELLNEVIYNKTDYYAYTSVEALRNKLLESDKTFECVDLGAGSSLFQKTKTVKQIAKQSSKPVKFGQLLFRLVNYFQPQTIIELGTSLGITSTYLAKANTKAKLITIEGCKEIASIAKENFIQLEINNAELIIGNFDDVLQNVITSRDTIDFVFFDGNHRKQPTLTYFEICLAKATENSVFVFDDIYWSKEMKQAWGEIKRNKRVTVTIDLFYLGIVFFRKEQARQDFVIRF